MLFPFPISHTTDDMTWTGQVQAFAYFAGPACRDQDRVATVYIARKLFEDGSTITVVRNVPRDGMPHLRAAMLGEGRVERDPSGQVVRLDSYTQLRPHGGSYSYQESFVGKGSVGSQSGFVTRDPQPNPVTLDRRQLQVDPKSGLLRGSWEGNGTNGSIELSGPRVFWLDRLEALSFGGLGALAAGWRFAEGTMGLVGPVSKTAGTVVQANDRGLYPIELAGRRESFRRIDLIATSPDNGQTMPSFIADTLLLRSDGGVAAYVPGLCPPMGPSFVGWDGYVSQNNLPDVAPPFALKGKLKEQWDQGIDGRLDRLGLGGVFLPTLVSPDERAALLDAIQPPEKIEPPVPPSSSIAPAR